LELWFKIDCSDYDVSLEAAVFMGKERVFMALMECTSSRDDCPYFAMYDQTIHRAPGNRKDTLGCALLYDSIRDCIYIFGGRDSIPTTYFSSHICERFLPSTCSVEQLPNLLEPRSNFAACWHKKCAYLCGGGFSLEKFDPEAAAFTKVCDLTERVLYVTLAFSYEDQLYMISKSTIWQGDGGKWGKKARGPVQERDMLWECAYVVSVMGNFCYFLQESECIELDMRCLTETSVPLPVENCITRKKRSNEICTI